MKNLFRSLVSVAIAVALTVGFVAPASAALNPVVTITGGSIFGPPGGVARIVTGTITFGAADTYTTGGITITPQQLGYYNQISQIVVSQINGQYAVAPTYTSAGNATLKFNAPISGASNVTAAGTTAVVTIPAALATTPLGINSQIMCQLDDAATGGGGSGTWAVTTAVSSCKYTSATSFTLTATAAAPAGNGNFTYVLPINFSEAVTGSFVGPITVPFTAYGQ